MSLLSRWNSNKTWRNTQLQCLNLRNLIKILNKLTIRVHNSTSNLRPILGKKKMVNHKIRHSRKEWSLISRLGQLFLFFLDSWETVLLGWTVGGYSVPTGVQPKAGSPKSCGSKSSMLRIRSVASRVRPGSRLSSGIITACIPAASAAFTPLGASSNTKHWAGMKERREKKQSDIIL